jgi:hypothetical protein
LCLLDYNLDGQVFVHEGRGDLLLCLMTTGTTGAGS